MYPNRETESAPYAGAMERVKEEGDGIRRRDIVRGANEVTDIIEEPKQRERRTKENQGNRKRKEQMRKRQL